MIAPVRPICAVDEHENERRGETEHDNAQGGTQRLGTWEGIRLGLISAGLLFAVFALVRSGFGYREATVLRDEHVLVAGRVDEVEHRKGREHADVRFTTREGRTVSAEVKAWKELPTRGDRVTICYAPRDPTSYVQDARICPNFASPRTEVKMGLVLLAVVAVLWIPGLLRRRS